MGSLCDMLSTRELNVSPGKGRDRKNKSLLSDWNESKLTESHLFLFAKLFFSKRVFLFFICILFVF